MISRFLLIAFFFLSFFVEKAFTQVQPDFEPTMFVNSEGRVFIQPDLPVYFFVAPEDQPDEKQLLFSESEHANPMLFDGPGHHYFIYRDPATGAQARHHVFADGLPPSSSIIFNEGFIFNYKDRYLCEGEVAMVFSSRDAHSGVKETYFAIDGQDFIQWNNEPFVFAAANKEIHFFSVDNVGNAEKPKSIKIVTEADSLIAFENIYFDHNSTELNPNARSRLISMANALEHLSGFNLLIMAHTDSRGTPAYNMRLSRERGETIKRFLANRGVNRNRLIVKALGQNQLVNDCEEGVECDDDEHQQNRRAEFRIILVKD